MLCLLRTLLVLDSILGASKLDAVEEPSSSMSRRRQEKRTRGIGGCLNVDGRGEGEGGRVRCMQRRTGQLQLK